MKLKGGDEIVILAIVHTNSEQTISGFAFALPPGHVVGARAQTHILNGD